MSCMSQVRLQMHSSSRGELLIAFRLQLGCLMVFIDQGKEIQEKKKKRKQ